MKLYIVPGSPYSRIAQIVALEKSASIEVEFITAKTRVPGSPYYAINPSGRVPFLVMNSDRGLEDSSLICEWLDSHFGSPMFAISDTSVAWEAKRLEASARSFLDGLAVWLREERRPATEQSPDTISHEMDRANRLADVWEKTIGHSWMTSSINMAQITLGCALGLEARIPLFQWRKDRRALSDWFDNIAARPSFMATAPVVRRAS